MSFKIYKTQYVYHSIKSDESKIADIATLSLSGPTGPTGPTGPAGPANVYDYGEMYINSSPTYLPISGQNNYTSISGLSSSNLNQITFTDNPSKLIISNSGVYKISFNIDGSSGTNNTNIIFALFVNDLFVSEKLSTSRHYQQSGDDGSSSINGLISLSANDEVSIKVMSSVSGNTFSAHNLVLTLVQLS